MWQDTISALVCFLYKKGEFSSKLVKKLRLYINLRNTVVVPKAKLAISKTQQLWPSATWHNLESKHETESEK